MSNHLPDEPQATLGSDVLLGLQLVADEVLDGLGLGGGSCVALAEFLELERSVRDLFI